MSNEKQNALKVINDALMSVMPPDVLSMLKEAGKAGLHAFLDVVLAKAPQINFGQYNMFIQMFISAIAQQMKVAAGIQPDFKV